MLESRASPSEHFMSTIAPSYDLRPSLERITAPTSAVDEELRAGPEGCQERSLGETNVKK
jgi:hypothetical protein